MTWETEDTTIDPETEGRAADRSSASPLFWRQLFSGLKDRQLIPVVGQDALIVEDEDGPCTLNQYIARRAEKLLEPPPAKRSAPPVSLNDLACRYVDAGGEIEEVYWAANEALKENPVPVPEALRKLARIEAFTLYVTTTVDDLLRRALDEERFGGEARTQSVAYDPERPADLPAPVDRLHSPVVYQLLGRISPEPDYVLTDEDTLEYVHALQNQPRQPTHLFDALRARTLLIIGSGYSDWLMRFFLRIGKNERLLVARTRTLVVEAGAESDKRLADFLRYFSRQTKVYAGSATDFIDELAERWEEHRASLPEEERATRAPAAPFSAPPAAEEHPIFISYASEDAEPAQALADSLKAAGLPVWFDKGGGLQGGEDYERKILQRINNASFFVPVLSRTVLTPEKRFFRIEWKEALNVERRAAESQEFIVPVRADDLPQDSEQVPARFRELHWMDIGGGGGLDEVVGRLQDLYQNYQDAIHSPR